MPRAYKVRTLGGFTGLLLLHFGLGGFTANISHFLYEHKKSHTLVTVAHSVHQGFP